MLAKMDPSEIACRVYDTFKEKKPVFDPQALPPSFSVESPRALTLDLKDSRREAFYGDLDMYESLQKMKRDIVYNNRYNNLSRELNVIDPFVNVGESAFGNKYSVVLANIDAIYKLTGHYSGLLKQRLDQTYDKVGVTSSPIYRKPVGLFTEDRDFIACSVNDIQGGFTNYLQFRVKNVRIYGMNPGDMRWNVKHLSTQFLNITYGDDGTGDLETNWQYFIDMVRGRVTDGVQLTVANGGEIDEKAEYFKEDLRSEEKNRGVLLQESLVGLGCCGEGGSVVIKVFGTLSQFTADW